MDAQRWEYKVTYVENWYRTSTEGDEAYPEEHERQSAFGRRFLNGMGADGWELVGIQHVVPGRAYLIFKRPLAEGAEPDLSVVKRAAREPAAQPGDAAGESGGESGGPQVASL